MIKCTVLNATHKNIPEMCEVLQKSQQDSFLLQFLSLSYSYLLTREFGLNIVCTHIPHWQKGISQSKAWWSHRLPKLKGETRAGRNSRALMFCSCFHPDKIILELLAQSTHTRVGSQEALVPLAEEPDCWTPVDNTSFMCDIWTAMHIHVHTHIPTYIYTNLFYCNE